MKDRTQNAQIAFLCFVLIALFVILAMGVNTCNAQYSTNVSGYYLYFDKLDAGQTMPTADFVITENATYTAQWTRGTGNVGYQSPYAATNFHVSYIPNTSSLWTNDTTATPLVITFVAGIYEVTCVEEDVNGNQSGRSQPFFLQFAENYAKVPFNFILKRP